MELTQLIDRIRKRPDFEQAGMIICHQGVVRATSRDGRAVSGLRVAVDHGALEAIIASNRKLPGILDIQIHINEEQDLKVGDTVMLLAVAGDFRENVISALEKTLNTVKTTVTRKTEIFR